MSNFDFYEYQIGQHFACALEYGDFGDMTEEEIREFNAWLENEQASIELIFFEAPCFVRKSRVRISTMDRQ